MNLEQQVTHGAILYINSIEYNIVDKSLLIKLIGHPEMNPSVVRTVFFSGIENFQDVIDEADYDPDCVDSVMGIQERKRSDNSIQYFIVTEQREISFCSKSPPKITELV
jgi:hypothetical protein